MSHVPAHTTALLALLTIGLLLPWLAPAHLGTLAMLWLFVVLALSWDLIGGQTGYPSLGNAVFFVLGMHADALLQLVLHQPSTLRMAAALADSNDVRQAAFDTLQPHLDLVLVIPFGGLAALLAALLLGPLLLRLPRPHFAIATLGLTMAAAELATIMHNTSTPLALPLIPRGDASPQLLYWLALLLAALTLAFFSLLHASRFRLALNAIRDDEHKAAAMGHPVMRNKLTAWAISACFTGMAGAVFGSLSGLSALHPLLDSTFGAEIGIGMVLMALLGGAGTFWGPVIGAIALFGINELLSIFLPDWRLAALSTLLVVVAVFLPQGIIGWLRKQWPSPHPTTRFPTVSDSRATSLASTPTTEQHHA